MGPTGQTGPTGYVGCTGISYANTTGPVILTYFSGNFMGHQSLIVTNPIPYGTGFETDLYNITSNNVDSVSNLIPGLIINFFDTNKNLTYGSILQNSNSNVLIRTIALSNTDAWSNFVLNGHRIN
jgi:hypothetical protein